MQIFIFIFFNLFSDKYCQLKSNVLYCPKAPRKTRPVLWVCPDRLLTLQESRWFLIIPYSKQDAPQLVSHINASAFILSILSSALSVSSCLYQKISLSLNYTLTSIKNPSINFSRCYLLSLMLTCGISPLKSPLHLLISSEWLQLYIFIEKAHKK